MDFLGLYATVAVKDLDAAADWYGRLVGRPPDDRPMPTLVQWRDLADGASGAGIQLFLDDGGNAGHGRMTIVVPSMDDTRARLAEAGLTLGPDIGGDFGRIAQLDDPEGNRVTLAEPPKGAS